MDKKELFDKEQMNYLKLKANNFCNMVLEFNNDKMNENEPR